MSKPQPIPGHDLDKRPLHWRVKGLKRDKWMRSSTNTILVNSTVSKPKKGEIIHSIALHVAQLIELEQMHPYNFEYEPSSLGTLRTIFCVLPNILSYLDYYDLCQVSRASKGMYMFSVDDDLWKHLTQNAFESRPNTHMTLERAWKYEFRNCLVCGIFDEEIHPLFSDLSVESEVVPSFDSIEKFVHDIWKFGGLAGQALVMSVVYLDRLMSMSKISLWPITWRRLVLVCMILGAKVWEELAVWNADFLDLFPGTNAKDLGQLEKRLLSLLNFNVVIKSKQYVETYFNLRTTLGLTDSFQELTPLDKDGEQRLELRSTAYKPDDPFDAPVRLSRSFSSQTDKKGRPQVMKVGSTDSDNENLSK